ncbi:acyl-[acyl-carrier-protein]--UDP-N-acetylglucosamine O-acyltransferase [Geoalkalibacter ferrihydriticus]|uniref:Acyl-[acyl-carrier-protein]--UDP-N-acetylglucosamine O-acyltransferase n=2 Tax=Geoalkalibacter ferrihydriticus TaxID=392333 RepID=A0A0C2HSL9_9BACT|nr:acyl-ACP--UDP-N-acetylglucosamine O-acyltransferase [Geoalkalibacter ferrihydriticus]KIH75757.1 UDP-N-acetylglucosamine acyltransferase [Geoalkalibacter ferrihydriticus DSM 17813]SDM63679.1 acyl-[acyl-carrier-protein]--UDP-N-acetylglucosamine O-acyltransferase [Geoalkalibacter ferrihydriticus]
MIHATAIIHPKARIGDQVRIGPFAVIGEHVVIGDRTIVGPHAVLEGRTQIGCDNHIFQFASVGAIPQDLKYRGEETSLQIGNRNIIREFVTIHLGTDSGGGKTLIGEGNLFMAYCHVAHDCHVGNGVIMANGSTLAGHVEVQDHAILGGLSAIHQFARVGAHVMVSGGAMVNQDIPPYTIAQGDRARTVGLNLVGLKRRGFGSETISAIKFAYRLVFRSGLRLEDALARVEKEVGTIPEVISFVEFIRKSQRGVAR